MADSPLKRLLVQASHYSLTGLLTMLAGLVSFPLLTRVFSVADYGMMNLVAATIGVSLAVGKLGLQHSVLRYHSEITAGKSPYTLPQLYATTLLGMFASALLALVLVAAIPHVMPTRWLGEARLKNLLTLAAILIVVQAVESALVNLLRAEQGTKALMEYQIAKRYLSLAVIALTVIAIWTNLTAFYAATVLAESAALVFFAWYLFKGKRRPFPRLANFSRPLYRELLHFGIPMMVGYELSGIVLAIGDRYVIEGILGASALGLYGAAYNLCQSVQSVAVASTGQAAMPIYMSMWDRGGPKQTATFVNQSLRSYVLVAAPIVGGLAAVGPELLPSLASAKYASASIVLPWVIAGMAVDGTTSLVGAGLFIHRKTRTIMIIILGCAALNVALNVGLVPRIGILGSAIATLVCYVIAALAMARAGRRLLDVTVPWATIARAALASGLMYLVVTRVVPGRHFVTVAVRAAIGAPLYAATMVLLDADARTFVGRVRDGAERRWKQRSLTG